MPVLWDKRDSISKGQKYIGAVLTDHLFTCIPSAGTKKIIVKVINHFKEEYTETIEL